MIPAGCEAGMLRRLAEMPFLDRLELAAVSGWSRGAVYEAIAKLTAWGMVDAIPHASPLITPTARYFLTAEGLRGLAGDEGLTVDQLLDTRPVSARWRRVLLERLDALAGIYRVAAARLRCTVLPRQIPVVSGRSGGRGNRPARRTLPRRGAPGQHRRPGRLRQAALAAVRGGAARRRAAAGSRRRAAAPGGAGPWTPCPCWAS